VRESFDGAVVDELLRAIERSPAVPRNARRFISISRADSLTPTRPGIRWAFVRRSLVLAFSLFFSGASALVYQVVWVRELTTLLGTTLEAVATVLGVFMLGLGIGGAVAARTIDRLPGRLLPRVYAALEIGIAAFALSFPFLVEGLAPSARFLPAVLLVLPTTLMGATLPTAIAIWREGNDTARSAGILYAANTAGAVAGSLATPLFLLAFAGMSWTTAGAASLNALAAVLVLLFVRDALDSELPRAELVRITRRGRIALAVAALSGFGALVSEVAWTRSLVLLIGPTTYGFSFVVGAVIFGLAIGSAMAARLQFRSLSALQLGAALSSLLVLQVLGRLSIPVGHLVHRYADDMPALLGVELAAVAALLFPASFFFGATFPAVVGAVARGGPGPGQASGSTLAWNTIGALTGSLAAGFLFIPHLGAEGALYAALSTHLVACGISSPRNPAAVTLAALAIAAIAPVALPRWDRELLTGGLYKYASYLEPGEFLDFLRQGELLFDREDQVAAVTVKKVGSRLSLAIDGKVDATSSADMMTQRLLAHLPLLLHSEPRNVLVVGLGSGVTAGSALAHPVESVTAVEISPAVAAASRLFDAFSRRPWEDPRFRLVIGDGRHHLLHSPERFDVIISEPSNPWMAGVSSLFTREFFELARERLAKGGLFCQWAHIYNLSEDELATIVASFTDAFESAALFLLSESDVLLVGAKEKLPLVGAAALEGGMSRDAVREDLADVGVRSSFGFGALLSATTPPLAEWARAAERHTDDRPILELRAARTMHRDTSRENRRAIDGIGRGESLFDFRLQPTDDDLVARAEALERAESFHWAFETFAKVAQVPRAAEGLVRCAIRSGRVDEAEDLLRGTGTPALLAHLYQSVGRLDEATAVLSEALERRPYDRELLLLSAEVSGSRGDPTAMSEITELLLDRDPGDSQAGALLAESRLRAGAFGEAVRIASAVLAQSPETIPALRIHAVAHAELGNRNLARESFERLLARDPEDWVQLNNLARLELSSGNAERAAELFERAVDRNSRNLEGYRGLEESALQTGDGVRLARARSMIRFLSRESTDERGGAGR
jgi:spermidine synthase